MVTTTYDTATLAQLDIDHMLHPVTNLHQHAKTGPLVLTRGEGSRIWDSDGKRYIDGFAGLWNVNVGHGRAALADAASDQINTLAFAPTFFGLATPPAIQLAAKLATMYPGSVNHFQFTSGGAESNETAIKIARYFWSIQGKPDKVKILSRMQGYHGIAMGALSATGIPAYWQHFGPRPGGFIHLAAPYAYRNADGPDEDAFVDSLVAELEQTLASEGAGTIAAMIGEPVQGAGGVVVPPESYWGRVADVLKANDVLLIADEVITGFGRTGTMFGVQQYEIEPDIVSIAKGITSGYVPLGAVGISDRIYEQMIEPDHMFMHGFTYSGHPVACAVALANIEIIEQEDLPSNAGEQGAYLLDRLRELLPHQNVGEVRGKGLMMIVEVVDNKDTKAKFDPTLNIGGKLQAATRERGLIVRCSNDGIAIAPPLILTRAEADQISNAIQGAIVDVLG
ncbi:MAG TPA: aspartate aminotransferase family protein [Thermomicrobiales bacterium]|nr:aspartate aminotransferase family protein [Thermomicrobiales bacterium]